LGDTQISEFLYDHDVPTRQIVSWSQQAGTQTPSIYSLAYDPMDQLTAASVSEGGNVVKTSGYSYDPAGNRLTEQVDATTRQFSYNALNQLTSVEGDDGPAATYKWDAEHRLISVSSVNQETQFTYDGLGRRVGIRQLVDGSEVSNRRFVWCDNEICEERTPTGIVVKQFFQQGMKVETGATAGKYFYTRDHLGSVHELIDNTGSVRARFNYEPYGAQNRISGDLDVDFGFTGHFYHGETGLNLTSFRAYDPKLARWLSRDPLANGERWFGSNLYTYVEGDPLNRVDPDGLLSNWCQVVGWSAYVFCRYVIKLPNERCEEIALDAHDACVGKPPPTPNAAPCLGFGPSGPGPGGPNGPNGPAPGGPNGPLPSDPGGSAYGGGGGRSGGAGSNDSW
jgi:RHS repeat-associated protein